MKDAKNLRSTPPSFKCQVLARLNFGAGVCNRPSASHQPHHVRVSSMRNVWRRFAASHNHVTNRDAGLHNTLNMLELLDISFIHLTQPAFFIPSR
jgi:hypothetical protein